MNILDARRRLLGRNVYKKTTEGNPAIAQGSLSRLYPDITMQGWTKQNTVAGNQLFDASSVVDGIISNGEVVENGSFATSDFISVIAGNVYSRSVTGTTGNFFYDADKTYLQNVTGVVNTEAPEGAAYVRFCINKNDFDIQDIMLNEGPAVLPYEPYTGRKPSPNPDYPQEIVSAGNWNEETQKWEYEISVGGAQLFDISKVITEEGVVINNGDGTLTVKTAVDSNGVAAKSPHRLRDYCPDIVSGKTYYLYADSTGSEKVIYFGKSKFMWDFGSSRIITDDDLDSIVFFYASGISTEATVSNIMITEVSNAPYEQYKPPQTVTLTADRPLTKWDKLEKRNGQWGWVYKSAEIESYTDESVPGEYYSTTGQLSAGAQVWYETTTETFVPLTTTEQEAMEALHTYRPTTVLSNDAGCEMSLTYKARKSMEVTA